MDLMTWPLPILVIFEILKFTVDRNLFDLSTLPNVPQHQGVHNREASRLHAELLSPMCGRHACFRMICRRCADDTRATYVIPVNSHEISQILCYVHVLCTSFAHHLYIVFMSSASIFQTPRQIFPVKEHSCYTVLLKRKEFLPRGWTVPCIRQNSQIGGIIACHLHSLSPL